MIERNESPWCSRAEAASYLGFEDPETVDSKLAESETYQPGKLRYRVMRDESRIKKIRIWKQDVYAMLQPFEA